MINKIREAQESEKGFTLVELLVVIIIIGILAAVAIPAFLNQRQRANDAAVQADVKNVATQIETQLVEAPNANSVVVTTSGSVATIAVAGVATNATANLTSGVSVATQTSTVGSANAYVLYGAHTNGKQFKDNTPVGIGDGDSVLVFESATGGIKSGARALTTAND